MQPMAAMPASYLSENSTIDRLRPIRVPAWLKAGMRVASTLAPGAAVRLSRKLFFTPVRARVRDEERALLATGEPFSFTAARQTLVGRTWGEGPTVLLVHGWGGHAGQLTPFVAPLVAAGFRAVAIDLPGHGESTGKVSSVVHFAAAIERVAALFKPVEGLVAHSLGAAGSTYAMARGVGVRRAVYFAPPARFDSFWVRFRNGIGISPRVMERMLRQSEGWLDVPFEGLLPATLAPSMEVPLLVFHDPEDREMPFAESTELTRLWPGAELRSTAALGHLRILRDERSVREAVEFLTA